MRFWDSSAIVQCYLEQGLQKFVRRLYFEDEDVVIWRATPVECVSAFVRHHREGGLSEHEVNSVIRTMTIESDEVCETSYPDRGGKYPGQKEVTLPHT